MSVGVLAYILTHLHRRKELQRLATIRSCWATTSSRRASLDLHRWFARVSGSSDAREGQPIDDQTWDDLQLDAIYSRIDDTLTLPGQLLLYRMLRLPLASPEPLERRHQVATLFQNHTALRERLQLILLPLRSAPGGEELAELLWNPLPPRDRLAALYRVMTAAALIAVSVAFIAGGAWFLLLLACFGVNFYLHQRMKTGNEPTILSLQYLHRLLVVAHRLAAIEHTLLPELAEMREPVRRATPLRSSTTALTSMGAGEILYQYLSILFLIEARACLAALSQLTDLSPAACAAFVGVGGIDAHLAIASFRASLSFYTAPSLAPGSGKLGLEEAVHPLLTSPQPLTFEVRGRPILVTGPNMSGKSTFLRTIGVNAVLAQTVSTCTAKRYEADCFHVLSSLSVNDDLLGGRSLYVAEAEGLLRMIRSPTDGSLPLCLIDEILKGTNATERVAAAIEILRHLGDRRAITIAATHDTRIAVDLGDLFESYHFTVQDGPDRMTFDHRPHPGISTARNAIRLLSVLGFPAEVVNRALARADQMEKD
jgi:MutS domain V